MTSNGRRPQNSKSGISQGQLFDHPQLLNLSLGEHTKFENCYKWRLPLMEDDLKILKVKYVSNH